MRFAFIVARLLGGWLLGSALWTASAEGPRHDAPCRRQTGSAVVTDGAGGESSMAMFLFRRPIGLVPWGNATGRLPRARSDVGGLSDVGWSDLVVGSAEALWVRNDNTGAVAMVDPRRGVATPVPMAPVAAGDGAQAWSAALGPAGPDRIAILVAQRGTFRSTVVFRVDIHEASGPLSSTVALPDLDGSTDVPRRVWVLGERIWIGKAERTELYDLRGALKGLVPPGVPLTGGRYLAGGAIPRLYGDRGEILGDIALSAPRDVLHPDLAGPGGVVLTRGDEDDLPPSVRGLVSFQEVWRLDETARRLHLDDRIFTPTGQPARSGPGDDHYFLSTAEDFAADGRLVRFEIASQGMRFFVQECMSEESGWRMKFEHPEDLSRAERSLAVTEYLLRGGRAPDIEFASLFGDLSWRRQPVTTALPPPEHDSVLQALDPRTARRH